MIPEAVTGTVLAASGTLAWAVRGKAATLLAPSAYRGPGDRKALALTFDDGPSESTPSLLEILARHGARATFFQCGKNVERLPAIARMVAEAGHEIGNHTYSHSPLYLRHPQFILDELSLTQDVIQEKAGIRPELFRAPFGCRWFGLRQAQQQLGLFGVMWTTIAIDWKLDASAILNRMKSGASNGAILCLHDGRQTEPKPDVGPMLEAVSRLLPILIDREFQLLTVSQLLCRKTSHNA